MFGGRIGQALRGRGVDDRRTPILKRPWETRLCTHAGCRIEDRRFLEVHNAIEGGERTYRETTLAGFLCGDPYGKRRLRGGGVGGGGGKGERGRREKLGEMARCARVRDSRAKMSVLSRL